MHYGGHLLNVPANKIGEVHHSHPSEVHQYFDVVSIQARKSALIAEIFNYEFHQGCICVLKVPEREKSTNRPLKNSLDVRLIMISVNKLPLIPLLTYIWNTGHLSNSLRCQGECHTCQSDLTIMKMEHKQSCQLMMVLDSLCHLTKLITRLVLKACDRKRRGSSSTSEAGYSSICLPPL